MMDNADGRMLETGLLRGNSAAACRDDIDAMQAAWKAAPLAAVAPDTNEQGVRGKT